MHTEITGAKNGAVLLTDRNKNDWRLLFEK